jgi:hypothetical protein
LLVAVFAVTAGFFVVVEVLGGAVVLGEGGAVVVVGAAAEPLDVGAFAAAFASLAPDEQPARAAAAVTPVSTTQIFVTRTEAPRVKSDRCSTVQDATKCLAVELPPVTILLQ